MDISFALILLALVLVIYWPALHGAPVWDDDIQVMQHPYVVEEQWKWRMIPRVLPVWTWWCQRKWMGKNDDFVASLHLGNILLHWWCALLVMPIAQHFGIPAPIAALFYAVHPLASGAVSALCQRSAVMASMLLILGINASLYIWASAQGLARPLLSIMAGIPFFLLALAAKEDALGVIGLLALLHPKFKKHKAANPLYRDKPLKDGGIAGSLPPWEHFKVSFKRSLGILPFWIFGLKQSVYHKVK